MVAQQCVSCTPRYAWSSHGEGGRGEVYDTSGTWYSEEVSEDPLWLVVSWFRSWKLVCIESAQYTGFLEVLNRLRHKCALVRSSKSYVLDIVHCSISHGVEKKSSCPPQGSIHILLGKPWFGRLEESSIETFVSVQENQRERIDWEKIMASSCALTAWLGPVTFLI